MPPCANGPVFTVSRPSRNGSACATAGAEKRVSAAAAPATPPASTARRPTLRVLRLADITRPPILLGYRPPRTGDPCGRHFCPLPVRHWRLSLARQAEL